jgi:hypothetical protein
MSNLSQPVKNFLRTVCCCSADVLEDSAPANEEHVVPQATSAPEFSEADLKLATYLFARSLDKRPVGEVELAMLRDANSSVYAARSMLPLGRGNVAADLTKSNNESFLRAAAIRSAVEELPLTNSERAALAVYAGAGNCGEHSDVVMHVHAAKLSSGDRLHDVNNPLEDHEAVVQEGFGKRPDILLDAWGNGSAINVVDSEIHNDPRDLETINTYTQENGPAASADFRANLANESGPGRNVFDSKLDQKRSMNFRSVGARDSNIVNRHFAERVTKRIQDPPSATKKLGAPLEAAAILPVNTEIIAVGSARSLGANVRQSTNKASTIVQEALDLTKSD